MYELELLALLCYETLVVATRDGIFFDRGCSGSRWRNTNTFAGPFPVDLFETWLKFERTHNVWKIPNGLVSREETY